MDTTLESQRAYELAQLRQQRSAQTHQEHVDNTADKLFFRKILKICIVLDVIELLSLGTVGWVTGQIGDWYLYKKTGQSKASRAQKKKMITAFIGEFIPAVNLLPLRTILWNW